MAKFIKILDIENCSRLINIDTIEYIREDSDHEARIKLVDGSLIYTVVPYKDAEEIIRRVQDEV